MGFGSYDESEQEKQEASAEDSEGEGVSVHENEHEGEMTFDSGASTDDLLDQLNKIKDGSEEQ